MISEFNQEFWDGYEGELSISRVLESGAFRVLWESFRVGFLQNKLINYDHVVITYGYIDINTMDSY